MAEKVILKAMRIEHMTIRIQNAEGSPLVTHNWSFKAREQFRKRKGGDRTKDREPCDPEVEYEAAMYKLSDGSCGFPASAIKSAICSAAHKDLGIEKTLVRKGLFVHGDEKDLIRIISKGPKMREDFVRNTSGGPDLRYRPEFSPWQMVLRIEYDAAQLTVETIVNLINRAGYGVGIGEYRPEKDGDWGRFEVVTGNPMKTPTKRSKKS